MPPTVVFTAECDPLAGDGAPYCERISDAGGRAICIGGDGLVHGYLRARHSAAKARESFSAMVAAISALGRRRMALLRQKRSTGALQTNRRAIRSLHLRSNTCASFSVADRVPIR
jgi:hypothetical protein